MYKIIICLSLLFYSIGGIAQSASIDLTTNTEYSDDKEWPVCQTPKNIIVDTGIDYSTISWDKSDTPTQYEVKLIKENSREIQEEFIVSTNRVTLDNVTSRSSEEYFLKIRKRCRDKMDNLIYSDWEVVKMGGGLECDCSDLFEAEGDGTLPIAQFQQIGACLLVEFDKFPCENVEDGTYRIHVYAGDHPSYPKFIDLQGELTYQMALEEGVEITAINWRWFINSGTFCEPVYSAVNNDFEIDDAIFDLVNCGESPPCELPSYVTAKRDGSKISIEIDGITQEEFINSVSGINSADLVIWGIDGTDFTEAILPFYNEDWNNFDITTYQEFIEGFDNYENLTIHLRYYDSNNVLINCEEQYEIPIISDSDYCSTLNLLLGNNIEQTLNVSFNDENDPNYLVNALDEIGLKYSEMKDNFANKVEYIEFKLLNTNEKIGFAPATVSLEDYEVNFTNVPFDENFIANIQIDLFFTDESVKYCSLNLGPFEIDDIDNELPDYTCGEDYEVPNISNTALLDKLNEGDLVSMSGLFFIVKTVNGENGNYSGDALLANPFTEEHIIISYHSMSVNDEYQAFTGEINGQLGNPSDYPDFYINPDTISIGGDICQPPPAPPGYDPDGFDNVTGLNDRGFNENGEHIETGNKYDPNGFDINGEHESGGLYDEWGCDVNGYDENGDLCQRGDPVVDDFIDGVDETVDADITSIVDGLLGNLDAELAVTDCQPLRDDILALIETLEFDPTFIIGEDQIYLNAGMSNHFSSEPKTLILNTDRNEQVVELEAKHIELYHCDKAFEEMTALMNGLQTVSIEEIIAEIRERMKNLTHYQVDKFQNDEDAFKAWIAFMIETILLEDYGITHNDLPTPTNILNPTHLPNTRSDYYSMASHGDMGISHTDKLTEDSWLLSQGYESINGVDRGLYLEELYNQMDAMGDGLEGALLPIRIRKIVDNLPYDIYIDNLKITPTGGTISATFILTEPSSGKKLILKAHDISFGTGGATEESKLSLATAIEIRLSNSALLRINPSENTYVAWDCSGFSGMGISADIELCRNLVVPLDENSLQPLPDPERFSINFVADVDSWSDIYLEVDAANGKPFALAEYPDMIWTVNDLIFDFSDNNSPENISLHPLYTSQHFENNALLNSWRGVYLGELSVTMSSEFTNDDDALQIGAQNVVFDDTGISGTVFGNNVLPYEDGNLSGWQFSVDDIEIDVLQNHIHGGSMGGKINVPVMKNSMDYTATVYPGGYYEFVVEPNLEDSMDIFLATVSIDDNSVIQVSYDTNTNDFTAKATLHGHISVDKEIAGIELKYENINFSNLEISNKSPYFSPGKWHFPNEIGADLLGFGINMKNITPFSTPGNPEEVGLSSIVDLTLSPGVNLSASGAVDIVGNLELDSKNRQKWKFKRVDVNQFSVDAQFSAGHIKGGLQKFTDHDEFGNGFQGFLEAELESLGKMTAMGMFGNKGEGDDNFKFFFVDAMVEIGGPGIPAGPISINGFAGGLSHHMNRDGSAASVQNSANLSSLPPLGYSFSGSIYTPNEDRGLGIQAGALISTTGSEAIFNGLVSFGILFNATQDDGSGGGVEQINFIGQGQFMSLSAIESDDGNDNGSKPNVDAVVSAYIYLDYNFSEKIFDGDFSVYIDAEGVIKGAMNDEGKAVDASVYFAPDKWYIYIGTPDIPCGVKVSIPGIGDLATFETYLDVGTDIPNMPDLPDEVKEIAYLVKKNQTLRNTGAGFVYGASFEVNADLDFGIASGSLDAGLGFDVMVRNFQDTYCYGNAETDLVGFNGWYGMGQMWAYLEGEVKILDVNVLNAGIAAILQAQLPNPTFAQATVGVKFKVLFKTVHKSFKVAIGDACTFVSDEDTDSSLGMKVITLINPIDGTPDLETDATVVANLSVPVNTQIELPSLNNPDDSDIFRVSIKEITLSGEYGEYEFAYSLNDDKTQISINNDDLFSAEDTVTATVEVSITKNGEEVGTELESVTFAIGKGYTIIPESNIEYTYPIEGMHNFHKAEYNDHKGYIQLKQGMPELFDHEESNVQTMVKITGDNGDVHILPIVYDYIHAKITYDLEPELLVNNTIYKLEIIDLVDGTYSTSASSGGSKGLDDYMPIDGDPANPDPSSDQTTSIPNIIYTSYFRTSIYDTYKEKIDNVFGESEYDGNKLIRIVENEEFTTNEIEGFGNNPSLISFEAELSGSWINNVKSQLYSLDFPYSQIELIHINNSSTSYNLFCQEQIGSSITDISDVLNRVLVQ